MKKIILTLLFIITQFYGYTQCKLITLSDIKLVYKSNNKKDFLLEKKFVMDFDSISYYGFVNCRKVVAESKETSITSFDESFTLFDSGKMFYSTYSNAQYLKLKKEILLTAKKTIQTEQGYEFYFDGKTYYGFKIVPRRSTKDKNLVYNEYKIMFSPNLD